MITIIGWTIIFFGTLYVLIKSADYFTEYSEKLGLLFGMSSFIIGATVVAVGTSLPELVASLYAVIGTGETSFVLDAIVGSNIANALLILGIGAIFAKTLQVKTSLIDVDLPFFFMSMGIFLLFSMDKMITWVEGIFLFIFFIIFVVYSIKSGDTSEDKEEMEDLEEQFKEGGKEAGKSRRGKILSYGGIILLSMVGVAFASKYFIDSLLTLSTLVGISSSLLTVSVVAIGTSLPEILTSIAAIRRGNHGMALGNVFGSNTFNIALVGSIPAFFSTLHFDASTFAIGLPFLAFATLIAIFVTFDNKIRLWEGIAMLFIYVIFLGKILQII